MLALGKSHIGNCKFWLEIHSPQNLSFPVVGDTHRNTMWYQLHKFHNCICQMACKSVKRSEQGP